MYITPRGFSWDEDEEGSTMVVWCGVAAAMETELLSPQLLKGKGRGRGNDTPQMKMALSTLDFPGKPPWKRQNSQTPKRQTPKLLLS